MLRGRICFSKRLRQNSLSRTVIKNIKSYPDQNEKKRGIPDVKNLKECLARISSALYASVPLHEKTVKISRKRKNFKKKMEKKFQKAIL